MQKIFTFICILGFTFPAFSQNGTIKGKIVDSTFKQNLADATVSVLNPKDSTPVSYVISDKTGGFQIKNLDTGTYRLMITFAEYRPFIKIFTISKASPLVDFSTIYMDKTNVLLQEVVVTPPPITVKKDTVEFNASAFKTKPNSTAEDLLKKIPGVQVEC